MHTARRLAFVVLLLAVGILDAQQGGDMQAQILYAYHTEDINSLTNLVQNLSTQVKNDSSDRSLRYHLAHAQFRLGELAAARHSRGAEAAFSDCIDELKPVLEKDVKSVEALTLQSACYFDLADLRSLQAVLLRARSEERLKAAVALAPRNPRVLLISATQELARSKANSPERQHAFAQLKLASQLFDETSGTDIDAPGWGHAEAYLAYGRELKSRGDHLGARNWIEKSLLAAPDFKAAQRQLALLAKP